MADVLQQVDEVRPLGRVVLVLPEAVTGERRRHERRGQHGGGRAGQDADGEGDAGDDLHAGVDRDELLRRPGRSPRLAGSRIGSATGTLLAGLRSVSMPP